MASPCNRSPEWSLYVVLVDLVVVMAALLVWRRLFGGRGGQCVVADGRCWLRRRQAYGRGCEGVVGVEGVGSGRDVVVLGRWGVRGRPHDDKTGPATTSSAGFVHSLVVQQLWASH